MLVKGSLEKRSMFCQEHFQMHACIMMQGARTSTGMWTLFNLDAIFLTIYTLNSLCANFFRGKMNIYFHFISLLHIDRTQVLKILPQVRPEPTYSTQSISLLLMSWQHKEPGHQQP